MLSLHNRVTTNSGGMSSMSSFTLSSALHEWNYQNATDVGTTTTLVDTGTIGSFNMANPTAISEITLTDSYISDGLTQYAIYNTTDFRGADTTGVFHCKATYIGGLQTFIAGANNLVDTEWFSFRFRSSGEAELLYRNGAAFSVLRTNATYTTGEHTISVYCTGTDIFILVDGVKITSYHTDTILNRWMSYSMGLGSTWDNIAFGGRIAAPITYRADKQKYLCYEPYTSESNALINHNLIRNTTF